MDTSSTAPVTEDIAGKQTETALARISLIVSTLTSLSTVLITVASDMVSTPWLVGSATVICGACLAYLFVTTKPLRNHKKKQTFVAIATASIVGLVAAWLYVYREDIRFSGVVGLLQNRPAVLVDEAVAGKIVSSKEAGVPRDRSLIGVLDDLVQERHHTRRVASGSPPEAKGAYLHLGGAVNETMFALSLTVPELDSKPALDLNKVQSLATVPELLAAIGGSDRFLASSFDQGPISMAIAGPPPVLPHLISLAYHAAIGVRATRESNKELADAHFRQLSSLCAVTSADIAGSVAWLPDILLFGAHRALAAGDVPRAERLLAVGRGLLPNEMRLQIAQLYFKLLQNDLGSARQLAQKASVQEPAQIALVETFLGVLNMKDREPWDAIEHFEVATENASAQPPAYRLALHLLTALLLSNVEGDPKDLSARILKQTVAAQAIAPDLALVTLLMGYGSALANNTSNAERAFDQVCQSTSATAVLRTCEYWRAMAYNHIQKDRRRALEILKSLEQKDPTNAQVLGLLAELNAAVLYAVSDPAYLDLESVQQGFGFANRALKQDPNEGRSRRVLAAFKVAEAARNRGQLRTNLLQEALANFQVALRQGRGDSILYQQLSDVYRDLAQTADAKVAARRVDEVGCKREHRFESCGVTEVRELLAKGDARGAHARMEKFLHTLSRSALTDEQGNELLIRMAVAWYEEGYGEEAQELYDSIRRNVAKHGRDSHLEAVMATVDCNEGFILVDSGKSLEAQQLFRRGLGAYASADCEAGLAIALFQGGGGNRAEALERYLAARRQDDNYSNPDILSKSYAWSDTACTLVTQLSALER